MSKAKDRFCTSYCMTLLYISATFDHLSACISGSLGVGWWTLYDFLILTVSASTVSMTQFYDLDKSRCLFSIISLWCYSIAWLKYLAVKWLVTHSSHNENPDPVQEDNHYASYRGNEPASHGCMIGLAWEMTGIISLWSLSQIHDHLYIGGIYPTRRGPPPT